MLREFELGLETEIDSTSEEVEAVSSSSDPVGRLGEEVALIVSASLTGDVPNGGAEFVNAGVTG